MTKAPATQGHRVAPTGVDPVTSRFSGVPLTLRRAYGRSPAVGYSGWLFGLVRPSVQAADRRLRAVRPRIKSRCAPCAELYRSDWAAIARSGIFDGNVTDFKFYLLTLTAPSFGRVHRVPRSTEKVQKCGCGALHAVADAALRGVPLDPSSYDYAGQVAWNRDSGVLWDRTRKRLRDRWDSLEYFLVREWQDRGVLHLHLLVRIARFEAPSAAQLRDDARSAVAFSKIDGSQIVWGAQARCDAFRADGAGARTVWYLSKALGYMLKDTALHGMGGRNQAWEHQLELEHAATEMRCSKGCIPWLCKSRVHERYGSRAVVPVESPSASPEAVRWALESLAGRARRELDARAAAVP